MVVLVTTFLLLLVSLITEGTSASTISADQALQHAKDMQTAAIDQWRAVKNDHDAIYSWYDRKMAYHARRDQERVQALYDLVSSNNEYLEEYCRTETVRLCRIKTEEIYQQHVAEGAKVAALVASKTTAATTELMERLIQTVTKAEATSASFQMVADAYAKLEQDYSSTYISGTFQTQIKSMNNKKKKCIDFMTTILDDIQQIQMILVGNICFELDGVKFGEVQGVKLNKFEEAVLVVMQSVLAQQGIAIDILYAETVQQHFIAGRRRQRLRRHLSTTAEIKKGIEQLRLILEFQCNCEVKDPISDVYSDRRRGLITLPAATTNGNLNDEKSDSRRLLSVVQEHIEDLLKEHVTLIYGHDVTVHGVPCAAISYTIRRRI